MIDRSGLTRELLERAFPGQLRTQRAFEAIADTAFGAADLVTANVEATDALQAATVVTLSPNAAFANERVLAAGPGLTLAEDGVNVVIRTSKGTPAVSGGYQVRFYPIGDSELFLPLTGTLATRENVETLQQKTLDAPKMSGLGNYLDDAAAAAGGIPVGGVYRNGSALMIRVT